MRRGEPLATLYADRRPIAEELIQRCRAAFSVQEEAAEPLPVILGTVDRKGRPRSRILHPIWDGTTGWIATGRHTLKAKHISSTPYVTLSYWDPDHEQVMVDCAAAWQDDPATRQWLWNELKTRPEPVGYDPTLFWDSVEDPNFGALKLEPWRMEVWSLADMSQGRPPQVFRPGQ